MANAAWGDLTWNTGTFGGINDQNVSVTGQSLTTSLSSVTALFQPNAGWGVSTWGTVPWGEEDDVVVSLTGQSLTLVLGDETVKIDVNISLTGQS